MIRNFTCLLLLFSLAVFSQTIGITPFGTGFSSTVEITHAGDSRLFVVQKGGAIRILNADGTVNPTNFITLTSLISTGSERGLLGLAFHPNYATNGYFYVNYTRSSDGATVVARYTVSTDPDIADASTGLTIIVVPQPFSNHNGGTLKFGPDGYLYIGMGDGGSGDDPGNRAQNINENLGKMLRLDVDSASPYAIPPGNPFVGVAGNDEIWAIGLRNPWKFSFNRLTGDLWIADVGQFEVEEINKISNPLTPGLNFGWRCYEGNSPYITGGCAPASAMTMPFAQYTHSGTGGCSITGGYLYTGSTYPNFAGKYFFADYCQGRINFVNSAGTITYSPTISGLNLLTTFGEDMNGELYIASGNGTIYKIIDTSLGMDDYSKNPLIMAPNPADDEIFITSDQIQYPATLQVYDLAGKLLINRTLMQQNEPIATATLQSGMYLIRIDDYSGNQYSNRLAVK